MPIISFPLDYLRRFTETTPQQLEQQAFDYGLEATLREDYLDVEVTAERPDLLSAEGFTRAINIYNRQVRSQPDALESSGWAVRVSPDVLSLRPYIAALVVENVSLGEAGLASLIQFQEKVTQTFGRQRKKIAIGIYDLDKIVGDIDYTTAAKAKLAFVPLQEQQSLTAQQILTEHPNGLLYGHTLPASDRVPVLQDSQGQVLSLPPIINAAEVGEVLPETRNLFIDVTGISEKTVRDMINILAHNFLDTGSTVKTVAIHYPRAEWVTPTLTRRSIPFSAKFLNEILGTAISKQDLGQYLTRMDLFAIGTGVVQVPTYRTDIFSDVDIAGDLLVAIGIDNLKAEPTALKFHLGTSDPLKQFVLQVGDLAQRMGLMEVKGFMLTDPEWLAWFDPQTVHAENAKSRTLSAVRGTLQAGLLEILSRNINAPKPINIYESGEVVVAEPEGALYETVYWGFASLDSRASFTTAKAYVQTLLKALGIAYALVSCGKKRYISGRAATVMLEEQAIGHFGEIHPAVLNAFSFPEPVCSGELDCQVLMGKGKAFPSANLKSVPFDLSGF